MILCYPVISSGSKYAHKGHFNALLGEDPPQELLDRVSLEDKVSDKTTPAFIWHTYSDELVPVQNSLIFANALGEHGIPFELHIFPEGLHGLSLANKITEKRKEQSVPYCANWMPLCREWFEITFK